MSVAARCRNAIDYSKPIDRDIERLILDRLEIEDTIRVMSMPTIVTGDGDDVSVPLEEYKRLMSVITPWIKLTVSNNSSDPGHGVVSSDTDNSGGDNSFTDKIAALRAMLGNNLSEENTEE